MWGNPQAQTSLVGLGSCQLQKDFHKVRVDPTGGIYTYIYIDMGDFPKLAVELAVVFGGFL